GKKECRGDGVPVLWSHSGTRFIAFSRAKWTLCGEKSLRHSPPASLPTKASPPHPPPFPHISISTMMEVIEISSGPIIIIPSHPPRSETEPRPGPDQAG
ncbi:hypothetical protein KUCAC02_013034, partial [Chaenocephalus aceratus]